MLYSQCTQAPARDTVNWRSSHYENPHYTFETDCAVHPASRCNQEQTVADPDGQTAKKIG